MTVELVGTGDGSRPRLRLRRERQQCLTENDRPAVEVVVVPHSEVIQAEEDALSLALVALVGGTRPLVTTAMVREYLCSRFNVGLV